MQTIRIYIYTHILRNHTWSMTIRIIEMIITIMYAHHPAPLATEYSHPSIVRNHLELAQPLNKCQSSLPWTTQPPRLVPLIKMGMNLCESLWSDMTRCVRVKSTVLTHQQCKNQKWKGTNLSEATSNDKAAWLANNVADHGFKVILRNVKSKLTSILSGIWIHHG